MFFIIIIIIILWYKSSGGKVLFYQSSSLLIFLFLGQWIQSECNQWALWFRHQMLIVSHLVRCLSDNKGDLNTSQCATMRVVLVLSPDVQHVYAGPVSLFSPGKYRKSSCPYQCAGSLLTACLGCTLHDSSPEVALICQDFNKIKPPTRPPGEREAVAMGKDFLLTMIRQQRLKSLMWYYKHCK